jgi:hypothetical protein
MGDRFRRQHLAVILPTECSVSSNQQFERAAIRHHVRSASAPFHYALALRLMRQRAVAQLQR